LLCSILPSIAKLRGCDVVALQVEDVAPNCYAVDRAIVRQKKTGRPVKFELTDQTRQAVDDFLKAASKKPGEYLFTARRGPRQEMTTRQYARLLTDWWQALGSNQRCLERTPCVGPRQLIYRRTGNLQPCSSCSVTPRSRALSDILALRWMMLSR
jgi:hypothetical protein